MNHCTKLTLAGVIFASVAGASFTRSFAYNLYFAKMTMPLFLVAALGWVIATYGPIFASTMLWLLSKRSSRAWLYHMSLLPILIALLSAGNGLMIATLDVPDFDDTLGAPILPALFIQLATLMIYFLALVLHQAIRLGTRSGVP